MRNFKKLYNYQRNLSVFVNVGEPMPILVIYSDLGVPRRFQQMLPQVQCQPRQAVKCFARYVALWYNMSPYDIMWE